MWKKVSNFPNASNEIYENQKSIACKEDTDFREEGM